MVGSVTYAAEPVVIPDGGLEGRQWTISERAAMSSLAPEPAIGKQALLVRDADEKDGSNATSPRFKLAGPGKYTLKFQAYPMGGSGLGVYVRLYDAAGKQLQEEIQDAAPSSPANKWQTKSIVFYTSAAAVAADIWIHSYSHAKVQAVLDDFTLSREPIAAKAPWPGEYKIRPDQKERLTEADVVGPDGIVYPDWTYAGIPGGIPQVAAKVKIEEFGGAADDRKDDAEALQKAVDKLSTMGGGAVVMGAGVYHLDRPVYITSDGIVLRGAGQEKTRLIFRYAVAPKTVQFFRVTEGQVVTPTDWIEAHAHPKDLRSITVTCDGKQIARNQQGEHSGNMFSVGIPAYQVTAGQGMSERKLIATAEYADGSKATAEITVKVGKSEAVLARVPRMIGAISFAGAWPSGPQIKLAEDGQRGSRQLVLADASSLKSGDRIRLKAPATPRWNALVQNACPWGDYRRYDFVIAKVEGNRVTLNQPMRIEFPVIDGSFVQKLEPIRGCGVEDFTLEQVENLWINGVTFSEAWECWARGVTIKMAGRNPLYTLGAKWCEIRDCVFDNAHFKGGGGTAYCGFEVTCDSLMENVTTYKLRHAPLFQWSAAGNVIRNSTFHASDGQWHSGWTNENLFENCVIDATTGNGAYGYGLWGSPPEDTAHGPNGPRNVVYNCDVKSPKAGLWMGGMNENWLILYNRFTVGSGPAVFAKSASFDHILRGNHFVLQDGKSPTLRLATPDCVGVEMIDNTTTGGSGKTVEGTATLAVNRQNTQKPAGSLERPTPPVPSIFAWQRQNRTAR